MTETADWISEADALNWLACAYDMPPSVAIAALRRACGSSEVEKSELLVDEINVDKDGFATVHPIPPTLSKVVGDLVGRLEFDFSALRWYMRQKYGEPRLEMPAAATTKQRGPVPGTTDKIAQKRRALFPKITAKIKAGARSVSEAVDQLNVELPGNGTQDNNKRELVRLFRRENP
jgi:hypothetical protein